VHWEVTTTRANVENTNIALTPKMAGLIRGAVESGEYASTDEVVREALREWKQPRSLRQSAIEELRRLWAEGLASGPGHFAHIDEIKAEGRRRRGEQQDAG
jgi:antitoxin ParD1/3/4